MAMHGKYRVESFNRDHRRMTAPHVSVVGALELGGRTLYKYDVRLCRPNAGHIPPEAMHAMEHIIALEIRGHLDGVWDLSPMGCMTGMYLSVLDEPDAAAVAEVFRRCLRAVLTAEEVPAANERECGNWRYMDLPGAKRTAALLLEQWRTALPATHTEQENA
jgi:S-ribosylhomocysteine lyase